MADEADQVVAQKVAIRRAARARRRELAARRDLVADAERLAEHVVTLVAGLGPAAGWPTAGRRCRVAAYVSYGVEPPTDRLVARLVAAGHEVILPRMLPDRSLQWADAQSADAQWAAGGPELGLQALSTVDVIVTPGLAVDRMGTRLGQGGGSYDRALVHRRTDALVVTLLHDGELREVRERLPHSVLDAPVDGVVTADQGFVDLR